MSRFHQVLDDKPAPAKTANQLLPAMQKLNRARLTMLTPLHHRRQWTGAIVRFVQRITASRWQHFRLQRCGLFMLAEVKPARRRDSGHLPVNSDDVWDVTGADRLNHHIKSRLWQHGQILHRSLDDANSQPSFVRHPSIQLQHRRTQIHHGDARSRRREQHAVLPTTGRETQDAFSPHVALQPAAVIHDREGIAEVRLTSGFGMGLPAPDSFIPSASILFKHMTHPPLVMSERTNEKKTRAGSGLE